MKSTNLLTCPNQHKATLPLTPVVGIRPCLPYKPFIKIEVQDQFLLGMVKFIVGMEKDELIMFLGYSGLLMLLQNQSLAVLFLNVALLQIKISILNKTKIMTKIMDIRLSNF